MTIKFKKKKHIGSRKFIMSNPHIVTLMFFFIIVRTHLFRRALRGRPNIKQYSCVYILCRQSNLRIPRLRSAHRFLIEMLQTLSSPPNQSTLLFDSIQFKVQINSPAKLTLSRVSPRALMGGIFLRRFFPEGRRSKLL